MTRRTALTVLFWTLAAALAVCHVIVAWHSLVVQRMWEDEAFNLTVPLNLLAGYGYTSDGALSGSTLTPFDARISTGPTVLLPAAGILALGADPVIGARLVPLAFWMLLLAGLAVLGHRTAGRWAALLAVAVPLAFDTTQGNSPIQGPADLLGEIPAAALLVWAIIVLPRRAWFAGLLVGLAVQTKFIALLALPAFAVAMWVLSPADRPGLRPRFVTTFRRGWLPLIMVGVPTLLFELWALLSLGFEGYIKHLRGLAYFIISGGQNTDPKTVGQKLETIFGAWFAPLWVVVACAVVAVVVLVVALTRSLSPSKGPSLTPLTPRSLSPRNRSLSPSKGARTHATTAPTALLLGTTGIVGLLTFVGWWSTASHLPLWVRHPAVGVYAFTPLIAITVVWSIRSLWSSGDNRRLLAALSAVLIVASTGWGVALHTAQQFEPRVETLAEQRADVAPIAEWVEETGTQWLAALPWGRAIPPIVLSGAHAGLWDASAMDGTPRLTPREECETEELFASGKYRICAAP